MQQHTYHLYNELGNDFVLVCNAMRKEHNLYVILQCTTLDRKCNAMQCKAVQSNAKQCNATQSNAKQCKAMQSNAKQCNTMQCNNTRYVFNEHGNDLVLECNAMQYVHNLYVILQCTTLER